MLGVAAPVDEVVDVGFGDLPRVSVDQPVVGLLDLPAVVDLLVEDAELVADAVADGRALEGGQRVEITGGQPPEAAVAQPGFLLACQHLVEVLAEFGQRSAGCFLDSEVDQVVAQLRSHQELGREVARHLAAEIKRGLGGRHPVVLHAVAHGQCRRLVVVLGPQGGRRSTDRVSQMVENASSQRIGGESGATVFVAVGSVGGWGGNDVGHRRSVAGVDVRKVNATPSRNCVAVVRELLGSSAIMPVA